jgi:hypothetical protein
MSTELDTYKKNRINNLNRIYRIEVDRLNRTLANNIRLIQMSNLRNKTILINNFNVTHRNNIARLTNNLNASIAAINNFKPEFNVTAINKKKALLVGINYINTAYELSGCINDVNKISQLLTKLGFQSINVLTDNTNIKPTKQNILNEFKNLIINASANDILFFHFSGHGSYTYDKNNDETDNKDEMIISSDLQGILDDEFRNILQTHLKQNVTLVGLFDSCHSGSMFDLKYIYLDSDNYDKFTENDKVSECRGNVIMISGCMDSQTSAESIINNNIQGAMTWSFIETINKNSNVSWRELLKSMRDLLKKSFTQIPQLSTDSFYDIDSKIFI